MPAEIPLNGAASKEERTRRFAGIRDRARRAVVTALYWTGFLRCLESVASRFELSRSAGARLPRLRSRVTPKFAVLCYHRVGTVGVPLFSRLQPTTFEAQMRYLRQH